MSAQVVDLDEPIDLLADMVTATDLLGRDFAPIEYVVPGVIPEGLTVLAAAPKIGKSWMVLGIAVAAASGGFAFGHVRVDQRPVLYLALEDGHRRLQSRLRSIGVERPPHGLHFLTDVQAGRMLGTITQFLDRYRDRAPLVVLDTLGKCMPPAINGETTYARDYRVTGALKRAADQIPGASLLVVHHSRKAEAVDYLDSVSGTQGISGAADTIAVLRRNRQEQDAVLHVTSRDAQEGTYALTLDDDGSWRLDGEDLAQSARNGATSLQTAGVSDRMAELIAYVNRNPQGVRRTEVGAAMHMEPNDAGRYLRRATESKRIECPERGLYTPLSSLSSCLLDNSTQDRGGDSEDKT